MTRYTTDENLQKNRCIAAFGKELGSWTQNVTNRYTYTAREYDTESEQYYYRARYYSGNGRLLRRDPAGMAEGPNLYTYVHGSPLTYSDPSGMWVIKNTIINWGAKGPIPMDPPGTNQYMYVDNGKRLRWFYTDKLEGKLCCVKPAKHEMTRNDKSHGNYWRTMRVELRISKTHKEAKLIWIQCWHEEPPPSGRTIGGGISRCTNKKECYTGWISGATYQNSAVLRYLSCERDADNVKRWRLKFDFKNGVGTSAGKPLHGNIGNPI